MCALRNYQTMLPYYNFLVLRKICKHYDVTMKYIFNIIAIFFLLAAGYAIWQDLTNTYTASVSLGKFWYSNNPGSLQVAEAIISRYIDPCSLIIALDCSPFLWHPFVSTVLGWPAALVLLGLCMICFWLSLWLRRPSGRKSRARHLKRHGEK